MTTIETIKAERLAREAEARETAATIPPGDYYADGNTVRRFDDRAVMATVDSHSQAVRVLLAIAR